MSENRTYRVTRDGRVFSLLRKEERELKQLLNFDGYPAVRVKIDGKHKFISVHRLVAWEYLPPRLTPQHEVRHLDGDRLNPHADNLAWGTRKENAADRARHGRTSHGPSHSKAILKGLVNSPHPHHAKFRNEAKARGAA